MNSIEKTRLYYVGKLQDEIRQLEGYQKKEENTLKILKKTKSAAPEIKNKINTLTEKIQKYELDIKGKSDRIRKIKSGLLDKEIETKSKNSNTLQRQKQKERKAKKEIEKKEKKKNKDISRNYYMRTERRNNASGRERAMRYEYENYLRKCATYP